jgi:transglutaminase-like putative cysteine protease
MRNTAAFSFLLFLAPLAAQAQEPGFEFGKVTLNEIEMKSYPRDTSAAAVVLKEFGNVYIDSDDYNLRFEYHVKIKILRTAGIEEGDVEILLHRQDGKEDVIHSFEASSFNYEGGRIVESRMQTKDIYKQEANEYTIVQRFAIPNVKVGSVIEYKYQLESPWESNLRNWEFQSDVPKVSSEYWATFPPYYSYNITLRGFLKLSKNESEIIRNAFSSSNGTVDCTRMKFAMTDVPAFIEEKFMTASSNYLAAVNFELIEIRYPDGRVDKITTEWKDAADELRRQPRFGGQLKKAKHLIGDDIALVVAGETDPTAKARRVYDFVKQKFEWNGVYGKYCEGIRKAFDLGTGSVGDINLTLVASLLAADLDAEPVILSTRENGFPIELHPVLTDFNYVIARVKIDNKVYLLDATVDLLPFGLIPLRCINGKGRALGEKESSWQSLDAPANRKSISMLNIKVLPNGKMTGHVALSYFNYSGLDERTEIATLNDDKAYVAKKTGNANLLSITNVVKENTDLIDKPLVVKFDFEGELFDPADASQFLFNPFLIEPWKENPFKSNERLYPVDFGIPIDERVIVTVEFPEGFQVKSVPENVGLALPNSGGRYLYQSKVEGNKISLSSNLIVSRTFYSAEEYHYLRELFARLLQTQNADMVIGGK